MFAKKDTTELLAPMQKTSRRTPSSSGRHRRTPVRMEMIEDGNTIAVSCFELSAVGAYLYSDYLYCEGDFVELRLHTAFGRHPIEIVGEVIRVETGESGLMPGMGIAFKQISKQDSDELKHYLLRRFLTHV